MTGVVQVAMVIIGSGLMVKSVIEVVRYIRRTSDE